MKALVLKAHGGLENFCLREIEPPKVRPEQVLVRVIAASLNQIDNKIRGGLPIGPDLPGVLGCDFAGVVEELGESVTDLRIGDEVFGCAGGVKGHGGSLAEFIAADHRLVSLKPRNISMRQAAALPLVGITAWEAVERARVTRGEHVLVHGGTGGVGHIAVQLAKHAGARVAATIGGGQEWQARELGVDDLIFCRHEDTDEYVRRLTGGIGFSAIIDTVGGENLEQSLKAAAVAGRISTTASRVKLDLSPMHIKGLSINVVYTLLPMLSNVGRERHKRILRLLGSLVETCDVRPLVHLDTFTLATAPRGYELLDSGTATGKVVVDVA